MRFLADADYFVALFRKKDAHYKRAQRIAERYSEDPIFVTPFTIPESVTVLSYKENQQLAKAFLLSARNQPFTELAYSEEIREFTDQIYLEQNKKGTSWIDCLNVAMIRYYNLDGILSFDMFYKKQGIESFCLK